MRVLWTIKGLGPGGAEHLLARWARLTQAAEIAYEATYLLAWKDTLVPDLAEHCVVVHPLNVDTGLDPRWVGRLRRLIAEGNYDVVHAHSPLVAAAARTLLRTLPRQKRPAMITTEHNMWGSYRAATRAVDRLTSRLDDARLAVSRPVLDSLPAAMRNDTAVVVQGVMRDELEPLRADRASVRGELGLDEDDVVATTVANLRPTKAYGDLLLAARQVVDAGVPVRFLAVGQGPLEGEIRARHAELGLGDRFRLLGYRPDATRIVAAADLFVLSSRHEGFPIALMEALALGIPVVATAVGGIPEAVTNDREGLVVPPGRPDLLADAIVALAGDPQRRARMAQAALERGRQYDLRHAVERTEDLYRELVAGRRASPRPGR